MRDFLARTYDLLLKGGAAVAGFFHGITNDNYQAAVVLLALMIADYISGIVAAALGKSKKSTTGKLSSEAGAKGLMRKAMILIVVLLAYLLDWFVNEGNAMFSAAACWFYISNECLSLLENLALAGVPVPKQISGMLERLVAVEEGSTATELAERTAAAVKAEGNALAIPPQVEQNGEGTGAPATAKASVPVPAQVPAQVPIQGQQRQNG